MQANLGIAMRGAKKEKDQGLYHFFIQIVAYNSIINWFVLILWGLLLADSALLASDAALHFKNAAKGIRFSNC